jgi:hypothetical protein
MRRISTFTTVGAVLASLAIQPMAAGATPHPARGQHHHHAAARPPRKHHHATSRDAAHRARAHVKAETRKAKRLRARATAADAQLRALTAGRTACLSSLDPESRTLLTLRAGLNGSPRSVVAVARALRVSTLREQLLEQIAVLELRGATGGICAGHVGAGTLHSAIRLTATAPWLTRSST